MTLPRSVLIFTLTICLLAASFLAGAAPPLTAVAQEPTPTQELTTGTFSYSAFPIYISGGYIDRSQNDMTLEPPSSVLIRFAADGKTLEVVNFRYYRYDESYTYSLDDISPLVLRQTEPTLYQFRAEERSADADGIGGIWYTMAIRVLSPDRLELFGGITFFEGGINSKHILIKNSGSTPPADPRLTELPYPRCPGSPAPRLLPGRMAMVTLFDFSGSGGGVNFRDQPNKSGRRLASLELGELVEIVGSPVCADGLTYYPARYNNLDGYVAEGDMDSYWLEQDDPAPLFAGSLRTLLEVTPNIPILVIYAGQQPYYEDPLAPTAAPPIGAVTCPGALPSRLVVGALGRVSPGDANNMRAEASRRAAKIGSIPAGGSFTVLAGPLCADGFAWWQVNYNGLIGWTVEGDGSVYWLEPLG